MRTTMVPVTALAGVLLLAPLTLGHARAGTTSHGNWHNWHAHYPHAASVWSGYPVFDFWYGYYYYRGSHCLYHGWWRTCTVGDVTP